NGSWGRGWIRGQASAFRGTTSGRHNLSAELGSQRWEWRIDCSGRGALLPAGPQRNSATGLGPRSPTITADLASTASLWSTTGRSTARSIFWPHRRTCVFIQLMARFLRVTLVSTGCTNCWTSSPGALGSDHRRRRVLYLSALRASRPSTVLQL